MQVRYSWHTQSIRGRELLPLTREIRNESPIRCLSILLRQHLLLLLGDFVAHVFCSVFLDFNPAENRPYHAMS